MKNKKTVSIIMCMLMTLSVYSVPAYAHNSSENLTENYKNSFSKDDEGMEIVIYDADGNIVSTDKINRTIYVNGTQYNIPAGGTLQTYQYETNKEFYAGFYFKHK